MLRPLLALAAVVLVASCSSTPEKPEPLEVTAWQVAGDSSARPITLQFDAHEKRVSGFSGCNRFSGPYTLDHNQLSFGALMSTKMACMDNARNKTEQVFLDALSRVDSYMHEANTLTLYDANAAQLIRLSAMPADASASHAK